MIKRRNTSALERELAQTHRTCENSETCPYKTNQEACPRVVAVRVSYQLAGFEPEGEYLT